MSDDHDDLESDIRFFETEILHRPLTAQERVEYEKAHRESAPQREALRLAYNPMARAQVTLDFMRRLKSRQGTIMPDFEESYRRQAELDGKFHDRP